MGTILYHVTCLPVLVKGGRDTDGDKRFTTTPINVVYTSVKGVEDLDPM